MRDKREVGVFALGTSLCFVAHHMQNSESKVCRNGSSEIVTTALHTEEWWILPISTRR
jgi:hypothetical protein